MSSGKWHKFNEHLKSLITEGRVAIECKSLETKRLKDFTGYIITSNQDVPLKIDIGDSRVVCFNVSTRCRGNTKYFKRLGNILDHSDAPGVVMKYLLSLDISDFDPQEIPATKMKSDIMRDQLSNSIRFIIDYIRSWAEDSIVRTDRTLLYQKYLEWYEDNGEKPFSNNIFGKKLSEKNIIECKQRQVGVEKENSNIFLTALRS